MDLGDEEFEDFLPAMLGRLGAEGFIGELCSGFQVLMDCEKGVITMESLRRGSGVLGVEEMNEEELACMVAEGDLDGDGVLSQMEFCILMFRLSPGLMDGSHHWLVDLMITMMMF